MEDVGILYGHMVYFVVIWYIFPRFAMLYQEQPWQPCLQYVRKNMKNKCV
jgi:hypothetical protein